MQVIRHCEFCKKDTPHAKHILKSPLVHLVMSVLTLGMWTLFIMPTVMAYTIAKRTECNICGMKGSRFTPKAKRQWAAVGEDLRTAFRK